VQTTREHLIEIGLQRIHKIGYTATGVMEILDLAEFQGFLLSLLSEQRGFRPGSSSALRIEGSSEVGNYLGDDKLPPLKRLRKYFNELVKVYGQKGPISGCLLGQMSVEVAEHSPDIQSLLSSAFDDWQQAIAALLRSAVDRGDLPRSTKADELAAFLSIAGRALWSGLRRKRVISHSIPSFTSPSKFFSKSRMARWPANCPKECLHVLIDRSTNTDEPIALMQMRSNRDYYECSDY